MTESSSSRRPNLPALTGLRAVAALLVVFFHFKYIVPGLGQSEAPWARVIQSGYTGVSLFFVLSGFILAYTYLERDGDLRGSAPDFLFARFARVYPVYLFALIAALPAFLDISIIHPVGVMKLADTIRTAIVTPLLMQGWTPKRAWMWNGPGWSLSAEAFFYLLFPALGIWIAKRTQRQAMLMALAACITILIPPILFGVTRLGGIWRVTPSTYGPWVAFLKFSPLIHLPQFVLGIISGVAFVRGRDANRVAMGWISIAALAAAALVLSSSDRIPYLLLQGGVLAPVFAVLIYALACGRGIVCWLLSRGIVIRLGEASYALYLLHMPVSWYITYALKKAGWPRINAWIGFSGFVLAAIGVAFAAFYLIERPSRAKLQAWYRARSTAYPWGRFRLRSVLNPSG